MARYLLKRIAEMDRRQEDSSVAPTTTTTPPPAAETIVLDVGAGDGRLAFFLRRAMDEIQQQKKFSTTISLEQQAPQPLLPTVVATDDGSWRAPLYDHRHIRVERLSAVEALGKYGPTGPRTTRQKKERWCP